MFDIIKDYRTVSLDEIKTIKLMNRIDTKYLVELDGVASPVFNQVAIIELKQDKKSDSVIARRLKDENIRPCGISKYCVGMLLLYKHLSYKKYKINFVKFLHTAQWNYSV